MVNLKVSMLPLELDQLGSERIAVFILSQIKVLDSYGAWEWNLRVVACFSFLFFGAIRYFLNKKQGVDWLGFIHALVTGFGGLLCVYLSSYTETREPLRSVLCHGASTSLHRLLPSIMTGYAVFDLLDGLALGTDFLSHGVVSLLFTGYLSERGLSHFFTPFLIMEISTIFLNLLHAEFFTTTMKMANMGIFTLTFFLTRVLFGPIYWYYNVIDLFQYGRSDEALQCLPKYFPETVFVVGGFFMALNQYWFYRIIKKWLRKLKGLEGITSNNQLNQKED